MSDEEGTDDVVEVEDSVEVDESEEGPVPPCCGICTGLACLIVSAIGLFWNEGKYVATMQGLGKAAKDFVIPCDEGCSTCDLNKVEEIASGKTRAVRKGDLVYMACNLHNLDDISVLGRDFRPRELAGLVKAETWADKAGKYSWKFEMFQENYKAWQTELSATTSEELNRKCRQEKRDRCDRTLPISDWTAAGEPGYSECSGLRKPECIEKGDTCDWVWACPKIEDKAECRALEPSGECQWAARIPVIVKGQECTGCCPTSSTWRFACRPAEEHEVASRRVQGLTPRREEEGSETLLANRSWPAAAVDSQAEHWLPAPPRALKSKKVHGTCSVDMCTFVSEWSSQTKPKPPEWKALPLHKSGSLKYAEPPAYNLKYLSSGAHSASKVRLGAGSGLDESVSISMLEAKVFPDQSFVRVHLQQHTALQKLQSKKVTKVYHAHRGAKTLTMTKLERNDPSSTWDASSSNVGREHCEAGCICSAGGSSPKPGDLRVCFEQSNTVSMSLMAKVDTDTSGGWTLVEDKKLGVLIRLNEHATAGDLIEKAKIDAYNLLKVLRYVFPIIMWIGFYCCLSPIVWVLDTFGDAVETIPCVGGFAGGIIECVETLAEIAICFVSCCSALSCSLLIASFAWVWFRPRIGIPLLCASILLFVVLGCFAMSRRGKAKVRRKSRRSAREAQVNAAVEMPVVEASEFPQPVQFAVVCPPGIGMDRLVQVQAPDGRVVQVQVPEGVVEGQQFVVQA